MTRPIILNRVAESLKVVARWRGGRGWVNAEERSWFATPTIWPLAACVEVTRGHDLRDFAFADHRAGAGAAPVQHRLTGLRPAAL
jgi:hypothetical protein